jgi:hypothetical protein
MKIVLANYREESLARKGAAGGRLSIRCKKSYSVAEAEALVI